MADETDKNNDVQSDNQSALPNATQQDGVQATAKVAIPSVDDTIANIDKALKDTKYKQPAEESNDTEVDTAVDADITVKDDAETSVAAEADETAKLVDKDVSSKSDDTKDKDAEWEEVSPTIAGPFIRAAQSAGWSAQEIQTYAAEHTNEDLMMLTNLLKQDDTVPVTGTQEANVKDEDTKQFELDDDVLKQIADDSGEGTANLIKSLATELNSARSEIAAIKKDFGDIQQQNKQDESKAQLYAANEMFDAAAEQLPSLGKTDELPTYPDGGLVTNSPEMEARDGVYRRAVAMTQLGLSFRDAMKDALQWYKGGLVEQELEGSILKDLKRNEKRLSPKRSDKQTTQKFTSERERRSALVNEIARKHGNELPE